MPPRRTRKLAALIPPFGLLGAAAAYAAARWVVVIYLARLMRRELGLRLTPLLTPTRGDWWREMPCSRQ